MKRTQSALAALASLASLALLTACGLAPEEKIAEAEASYAANDFSGAKVYLVSALKDMPGDPALLTLLARTQIAMGDGDGALAALEQIAEAKRSPADHLALVAEAELLRGRFNEALVALGQPKTANSARIAALAQLGLKDLDAAKATIAAGEKLPGSKAGLFAALAQIELGEGKVAAAQATARRALAEDPESIDALLASGRTHQAANDLPATLAAFEKAAQLYPQNFAAALGRVAALGDMGRTDQARAGIEDLAKRAPKSIEVIHMRAQLALREGKWEDAREILQGNEAAVRDNPSMQVTYATALLRVGQVSQARAWLEPLVEDFPYLREPRTLLAEAQLGSGDPKAALRTIRALAERPDARPTELAVAAKAAKAAGDPAAERFAQRETRATPEWIGGELAKADTALRNQQWKQAVESYEAITIRTSVPNAMVLNNLAFAKSKLGDEKDAIRFALEAVKIAPDHPAILDTAGWILFETGEDRARGIAMLERAAKLDPGNTEIARRLAAAKRG